MRTSLAALGLLAVGSVAAFAAILHATGGTFCYMLDDPYPQASLLWPFVPAALGGFLPLVINLGASVATVLIAHSMLRRSLGEHSPRERLLLATLTAALVPACNLVGLAFTGTEQSLQVTLALVVIAGLLERERLGQPPVWLGPVLVLAPLMRYENLALSLPGLALLFWRGHRKLALATGAVLLVLLGELAALRQVPGLGVLHAHLGVHELALLGVGSVAAGAAFARGPRNDRPIAVFMLASIGLHLSCGGGCEVYVWATTLVVATHLLRAPLVEAAESVRGRTAAALTLAALALACLPYAAAP